MSSMRAEEYMALNVQDSWLVASYTSLRDISPSHNKVEIIYPIDMITVIITSKLIINSSDV